MRRLIQAIFIFLFFYLLRRTAEYPIPEKLPLSLFFRIDGLLAVSTTVSTGHFSLYFIPALVLMLFLLLRGNFFCSRICPFGGLIDFGNIVLLRKKWRFCPRIPFFLRKIRLFLLAGFLLLSFAAFFIAVPNPLWISDPYVIMTRAFILKRAWMVFFLAILASSIVVPRFWCNYICPLGCLYYNLGCIGKLRFLKRKK